MTVLRRHPLLLLFALVFFLGLAFFARLAGASPAVPDPAEHPIEFWGALSELHRSGGLYVVIAVAISAVAKSLARVLAPLGGAAEGWRTRAITTLTAVALVAGSLVDLLLGSLASTGLVVAAASAAALVQDPRDLPARSSTAASTSVLLVLLIALSSCSAMQMRARAANGVRVGLDCTAPAMAAAAREGALLARAAILSAIRDDGTPDNRALREAGGALRDQGWRCAFAVALAVLATPTPVHTADAPQALGLEIDGPALRAAGRELAAIDWRLRGSVLLPGGDTLDDPDAGGQ